MPQGYDAWNGSNVFQPQGGGAGGNGPSAGGQPSAPSAQPVAQQPAYQQAPDQQAAQQAHQQPPYQQQPYQQAPAGAYPAPKPKRGKGWIVAIVAIVCLFAFGAFCVKSCTDSLGFTANAAASANVSDPAIAVITLDGTIQYDGSVCSPEGFKSLLDEAADDERVKAVVLRVNSGGGTATAGEEMASYLRDFEKPVVVSSASINASAAYEISSQANYIYVAKSTEIGSIGTALEITDLSGLLDMLGIDMDVITSAESKDSSYGFRPLTDEEREYYQHMVDQINETFVENVADGRNMTVEQVRELATGLAFTGIDAVDNGLADAIGTLEDAEDYAAQLAGIDDYTAFDLEPASYDLSSLYDLLGSQESALDPDWAAIADRLSPQPRLR